MPALEAALRDYADAALQPHRWPQALDRLAAALGAQGATLIVGSTDRRHLIHSTGIADVVADYVRTGVADTRELRVNPVPGEGFRSDFADFRPDEIAADPFYQEFLRPWGLGWHAVAAVADVGQPMTLSLKRALAAGPFASHELAALDRALPALRRTARAAQLAWQASFDGELAAFDRVRRGAVLLDRSGRVLEFNRSLPIGRGLAIVRDRLVATAPGATSSIEALVARLQHALAPDATCALQPIAVPRPGARGPLVIDGVLLPEAVASLHARAAMMLIVTDPQARAITPQRAAALFALTRVEAQLAASIAGGATVRDAAAAACISEAHARQRLKSIFEKTGTRRQAELAALLTGLG